jgi:hypothetical protein
LVIRIFLIYISACVYIVSRRHEKQSLWKTHLSKLHTDL